MNKAPDAEGTQRIDPTLSTTHPAESETESAPAYSSLAQADPTPAAPAEHPTDAVLRVSAEPPVAVSATPVQTPASDSVASLVKPASPPSIKDVASPAASFKHGQEPRTVVLLTNLGTPDEPTTGAVRRYLAEFLSDRRVVEIPRIAWLPLLHGVILNTRPRVSAAKYRQVWAEGGSPLKVWTERQAAGLQAALRERGHHVTVAIAMRYGNPSIASVLDQLTADGMTRVLVLPAYPQYSAATVASTCDAVFAWAGQQRRLPELRFVNGYCDDPGYIGALAETVRRHWSEHGQPEQLLLSFHGMPERTLHLGDPYHCECQKTGRLLAETLGLTPQQYKVTFQSRFGRAKWLEPATEPTLIEMAKSGVRRVDVLCPGFASDCLETLEEISIEGRKAFIDAGGKQFHYIPCLNDDGDWIGALGFLAERHLAGWPTLEPADPGALVRSRERALAAGAQN
ncbi:MAG: ferrochelatase [Burkholderiales bacterium]